MLANITFSQIKEDDYDKQQNNEIHRVTSKAYSIFTSKL